MDAAVPDHRAEHHSPDEVEQVLFFQLHEIEIYSRIVMIQDEQQRQVSQYCDSAQVSYARPPSYRCAEHFAPFGPDRATGTTTAFLVCCKSHASGDGTPDGPQQHSTASCSRATHRTLTGCGGCRTLFGSTRSMFPNWSSWATRRPLHSKSCSARYACSVLAGRERCRRGGYTLYSINTSGTAEVSLLVTHQKTVPPRQQSHL
jgi:hypothetical protein